MYSLFLSRDAVPEDKASALALDLEAGILTVAVQSCWARTGSIIRDFGLLSVWGETIILAWVRD